MSVISPVEGGHRSMQRSNMKRVGLKFCGGCDCTYDRLAHWERIKSEAAGKIQWVSLDDPHYDAVLMIHGCRVACPEKQLDPLYAGVTVSVMDDATLGLRIVAKLMEKVFIPHLVCGP
jgi:hypothetical protein